jgi:hypothetical protein
MRTRTVAGFVLAAAAALAAGRAVAQDVDTPLDRSLQEVELLIQSLKDAPASPAVTDAIKRLEGIAKNLREEKASRAKAAPPADPAPPPGGGGPGGGGSDWAVNQVMEGIDWTEQERPVVREIVRVFYEDYASKKILRDDCKDRVERAVPKKKAGQLMNNIDTGLRRLEWGGRR